MITNINERLELVRNIRKQLKPIITDLYKLCADTNSEHIAWIEHAISMLQRSLYKLQEELESKLQ